MGYKKRTLMDAETRRAKILAAKETRMSKITGMLSHDNDTDKEHDVLKKTKHSPKKEASPPSPKNVIAKSEHEREKNFFELASRTSESSLSSGKTSVKCSVKAFRYKTIHALMILVGALTFGLWSYFLNFDTFECRKNANSLCFTLFNFSHSTVFLSIFLTIELMELLMDRIQAKGSKQLLGELVRDFCLYLLVVMIFNKSLITM